MPLQGKTIVDIAWHDGSLFYLDDTGGIHKVWYDNYDYFSSLSEIFHLDQFTLEQSSLISCGGKLWLSAAIIYSSGDKSQLDRIAYSGLVDVYANTVVALEGQADTIKYATANEDGSINFLMTRVFPIMPNPLPIEAKENSYWITIISSDEITVEPATDKGLVNRESQYFLAQDGTLWRFDASPYIEKGYAMVPVRGISYLLGLRANWNAADKTITLTGDKAEISLAIGKMSATVNGKAVNMDVPAGIQKGRTMVPLRFISEAFDAGITWDNEQKPSPLQNKI